MVVAVLPLASPLDDDAGFEVLEELEVDEAGAGA